MQDSRTLAEESLRSKLAKTGMIVWNVGKESEQYKLGIRFGVSLKWPEKEVVEDPVTLIGSITEETAKANDPEAIGYGPAGAAGGALVVYSGFASDYAKTLSQIAT